MAKNSGWITLDNVVQNVMLNHNDVSTVKYKQYLQWAIRGVRYLQMYGSPVPKTIHLEMDSNKSINLPEDYMKYIKVAMCTTIGGIDKLVTLSVNEDLCLPRGTDECGDVTMDSVEDILNTIQYDVGYRWMDHYHNGQFKAGLFSAGGGIKLNEFRVDEERRQIVFGDTLPTTEIVLEYISTGLEPDGTTTLPVTALETLVTWIEWQKIENKDNIPEVKINRKRKLFVSHLANYKLLKEGFTASEYLDSTRESMQQTPKR